MLKFARRFASTTPIVKSGEVPAQFTRVATKKNTYYE